MIKVSWLQSNNTYKKVEGDFSTVKTVPVGMYNIGLSMSGWYLEKYADKFTFDYKMYGLQTEFCEHVLKTYKNTQFPGVYQPCLPCTLRGGMYL